MASLTTSEIFLIVLIVFLALVCLCYCVSKELQGRETKNKAVFLKNMARFDQQAYLNHYGEPPNAEVLQLANSVTPMDMYDPAKDPENIRNKAAGRPRQFSFLPPGVF